MSIRVAYPCSLCGTLISNKRKHRKECSVLRSRRTPRGGYSFTEEQKLRLSEKRREYLKNNPDKHPWKNKNKFVSAPCERMKKILDDRGVCFYSEYTDDSWERNYSIDIAFPDKKIGVEINGNQHYTKEGKLELYYQDRHNWLVSQGWVIYEIPYLYVYINDEVEKIIFSIINGIRTDIIFKFCPKVKADVKKEHDRKMEMAKKMGLIRKDGHICGNGVPIHEYERRKKLILESGVDFTKFGWVQKVVNITGLTIHRVEDTIDRYKDDFSFCFRRKKKKRILINF